MSEANAADAAGRDSGDAPPPARGVILAEFASAEDAAHAHRHLRARGSHKRFGVPTLSASIVQYTTS